MRALVIGASGLVGGALLLTLTRAGDVVVGTYCRRARRGLVPLDITQPDEIQRLVEQACPDAVYLPAALTNVDWCEANPEAAEVANVQGPRNVIAALERQGGARLVYFSTDYVFDGSDGPYAEDDAPSPANVYGRQKLLAEDLVLSMSAPRLVVRTTWVYGQETPPRNFAARTLGMLAAGQTTRAPVDQWGNPTYAPNLAELTRQAVEKDLQGALNLAGPEIVTRYQMALTLARAGSLPVELVIPVLTRDLAQPAPRPLRGGLITTRAQSMLAGPFLGASAGLRAMLTAADEASAGG